MKTAVIFTGGVRTLDRCLPTIHWHVLRHFSDLDVFLFTVKDADTPKAEILREKYPNVHIEAADEQPEMLMPAGAPPPVWTPGQPYTHEPYHISVPPKAVLGQLWQLEQGFKFYQRARKEPHQLIIRCRPDLWFHSCSFAPRLTTAIEPDVAFTPWWGRFGGVNDRFAFLGRDAALSYFTTYSRIETLWKEGCPLHPESLVAASMEFAGIYVDKTLHAEFSTLRTTGEMRPPEITPVDIAHSRSC